MVRKKITVPWRNKDGTPRPLNNIKRDLEKQTAIEEERWVFNETNRRVAQSIKKDINTVLNLFKSKKR